MATKTKSTNQPAARVGDVKGVVQFEPCAAPVSKKRDVVIDGKVRKPVYTLRHLDNTVWVYGVDDCLVHGEGKPIRLNSFERYGSAEYLRAVHVGLLHLFAAYRGGSEIEPTLAVSVPISVYNEEEDLVKVRAALLGDHRIQDADGCELKIKISDKKLMILPESVGSIYHYAFDPRTLKARPVEKAPDGELTGDTNGNVLVVDVGYLTTDFSLHTDMKYQKQQAFTEPSMGMGIIALAIQEELQRDGRVADVSQIDAGLRWIAGNEPGPKFITIDGAHKVDVGPVYDAMLPRLASAIRDTILNRFKIKIDLVILAGGGAFHLYELLKAMLPIHLAKAPDAAAANVLGAYTLLARAAKAKNPDALIASMDPGNGAFKGVSSETL